MEECGIAEPAPAVAPETFSNSDRRHVHHRFARVGDRFIAFALDNTLLFGWFTIVDAWAFMRWGRFEESELQLTTASLVIAVTLNAIMLFLYGWLLEAACGATLGKVLVGIRVVRTTKSGTLAASAVRNLLRVVDGLGFYLVGTAVAACSEVGQRIGDICAHTVVIEDSFGTPARMGAIVLWVASLAGAIWIVPRECSANNPIHTRYLGQVLVRIGTTGRSVYLRIGGFTLDVHP